MEYQFNDETWDVLAVREVDWQEAMYVLRESRPRIRRFVGGSTLQIIAADRADNWMIVTLVEHQDRDEIYNVIDARYLTDGETEIVKRGTP